MGYISNLTRHDQHSVFQSEHLFVPPSPLLQHVYAFGSLGDGGGMEIMYFALDCPVSVLPLLPALSIAA